MSRRHGLDTLRACAIVLVMLFHASSFLPEGLLAVGRFGWMGVDLFFVLSGYLIAGQLFRQHALSGTVGWVDFYKRRALRVLPAFSVVLAVYVAVPDWREAPMMAPLWEYVTFTYNLFVRYPAQRAFSHVWSLCVEEQFYLVLPLLVSLLLRRPCVRRALAVIVLVVLAGACWRGWIFFHVLRPAGPQSPVFGQRYIEEVYYPTWSRMDGLLAGVVLAAVQVFRPAAWNRLQRHGGLLAAVGTAVVLLCCLLFRHRFDAVDRTAAIATVAGYPLLAAGFAALLLSSVGNGPLGRWRVPGSKALALLAFSLYLTHKAVLGLCADKLPERLNEGTWAGAGVFFGASTAVAGVLYFAVERPFLGLRSKRPVDVLRSPAL